MAGPFTCDGLIRIRQTIDMAADHREVVERGLALRRAGNAIMELLGGRAIHPVNVRVGGFYRAPSAAELAPLATARRAAPCTGHGPLGGGVRVSRLHLPA